MINAYNVSGMTCRGCAQIVHEALSNVSGVKGINVDLHKAQASIEMNDLICLKKLQDALAGSLYHISELSSLDKQHSLPPDKISERNKALLFSYLTAVSQLNYAQLHQYLHF